MMSQLTRKPFARLRKGCRGQAKSHSERYLVRMALELSIHFGKKPRRGVLEA
jgi:hypothetical protein